MIIVAEVCVNTLSNQGRSFNWEKPSCCPNCKGELWGHGHVFSNKLFLKRYRCNNCKSVITMKPLGFWRRYRTSINDIYASLRHRLTMYRWHSDTRPQRALHWLAKLTSFVIMQYGFDDSAMTLLERLDFFYFKNIPFLD